MKVKVDEVDPEQALKEIRDKLGQMMEKKIVAIKVRFVLHHCRCSSIVRWKHIVSVTIDRLNFGFHAWWKFQSQKRKFLYDIWANPIPNYWMRMSTSLTSFLAAFSFSEWSLNVFFPFGLITPSKKTLVNRLFLSYLTKTLKRTFANCDLKKRVQTISTNKPLQTAKSRFRHRISNWPF